MKFVIIISIVLFVRCNQQKKQDSVEYNQRVSDNIKHVSTTHNMVKLYNVTIKPREYTTESQSQIVRFQVNIRNKIFNIPIFKDDTILMKDNYYDLFKYSELNGIKEKDSAIAYVKLFSNSIMSLYHKLGIHEVQGGMPNIGELVILKSINGDQFVFVPDTNKIFSKHWKNGFVSEGRMIRDSIYLIPLTHE